MAVSTIKHNLVKTVYYSAGTDRTVLDNRYNALCTIMDMYGREEGSVIMATVRYAGGYYYTYFFGPAGHDDIVMELQLYELNIWNINRSSGNYYVFGTTLTQRTQLTQCHGYMATSTIKDTTVTHGATLEYDVDISSYSTDNRYIVPVDGYVWVRTYSSAEINMPNITHTIRSVNGEGAHGCVFVQKGTHVCVTGTPVYALFRAFKVE